MSSLQEFGSPISPVFMSISLCFQFGFFVYKIIKFQNNSIRSPGCITYNSAHLTSFDKNISDQLFLELQRTLLSGYHNIYSLSTLGIYQLEKKIKNYYFLVLSSLGGLSWVFIHYYHSSKIDEKDDINVACLQIPTSIFLLGKNIFTSPITYSKLRKNCILGVMMLFISMFQYVRNRALRIFFRKSINNFISKIWQKK